jgi:hypothetical protein
MIKCLTQEYIDLYHTSEDELRSMCAKGIDNIPIEFYCKTGLDEDDMIWISLLIQQE